ncbi:sugar isomerase domain-containing protein [Kineococcus gynurae]|uniref:Sugar isomerase domain-containing protein n=1 Tax=Kineococcus gynurae TaxID=452979 RepID=A0ABV5LQH0_9ACTN
MGTSQLDELRSVVPSFSDEVTRRLADISTGALAGEFDAAIELLADSVAQGGVVQAFGTGHSEAFAMEVAGRAGGLIPTNRIALRDVVLHGSRTTGELFGRPPLERDPRIAEEIFATVDRHEADVFVIASNSGVNGSVVGVALLAHQHGHPVVAVTSLEHTARVEPKHPSGKRLSEVADVVLDNRAPYGDSTLAGIAGQDVAMGAVSSLTSAYIAQVLTLGTVTRLAALGVEPPVYVSANVPGGDEHNRAWEDRYAGRIRRGA